MIYKLLVPTSLVLAVSLYVSSGGASFQPPERPVAEINAAPPTAAAVFVATTPLASQQNAAPELINAAFEAPVSNGAAFVDFVTIEPAPAALVATAVPAAVTVDLRVVAADRVNMRNGPSTDYAVLDTLGRGTRAEVLEVTVDGWAQIRLIDSGATGWMAERMLGTS